MSDSTNEKAKLTRKTIDGVGILSDPDARSKGWLVAFANRRGGVSAAPYDSLNLAARVGDDPDVVEQNRKRVARSVGFDIENLALARQVHETHLIEVGTGDSGVLGEADGLVTQERGPVAAILTADCAPVVIANEHAIAVLHAGWRGLVGGVIEAGMARLGTVDAAWVGPCIHACCYEVGPEVTQAFEERGLPVAGERRVDPAQGAATVLEREGVMNVAVAEDCTHCNPDYFSYRRDGVTGRQGAFAGLLP